MKYFKSVNSMEELKKEYRKLCKELHPDFTGDDGTAFKEMRKEYEELLKNGLHAAASKEHSEELQKIINELVKFYNIDIDVVGSWIWVSGETYKIKEQLKSLGFKFSGKRKMWYYAAGLEKKKRGSNMSFQDIINAYGVDSIKSKGQTCIA